jgi:hypothetical protein
VRVSTSVGAVYLQPVALLLLVEIVRTFVTNHSMGSRNLIDAVVKVLPDFTNCVYK